MESNKPQNKPQSNQDSSQQTEKKAHIADSQFLKRLNATWNQENEGQISVMPFRRQKEEMKSSPDNNSQYLNEKRIYGE